MHRGDEEIQQRAKFEFTQNIFLQSGKENLLKAKIFQKKLWQIKFDILNHLYAEKIRIYFVRPLSLLYEKCST